MMTILSDPFMAIPGAIALIAGDEEVKLSSCWSSARTRLPFNIALGSASDNLAVTCPECLTFFWLASTEKCHGSAVDKSALPATR